MKPWLYFWNHGTWGEADTLEEAYTKSPATGAQIVLRDTYISTDFVGFAMINGKPATIDFHCNTLYVNRTSGETFRIDGPPSDYNSLTLKNGRLFNASPAGTNLRGLVLRNHSHAAVKDFRVAYFRGTDNIGQGVVFDGVMDSETSHLDVSYCSTGLVIERGTNNNRFHIKLQWNDRAVLVHKWSQQNIFMPGSLVQLNLGPRAVEILADDPQGQYYSGKIILPVFDGVWFESNGLDHGEDSRQIYCRVAAGQSVKNFTARNCTFINETPQFEFEGPGQVQGMKLDGNFYATADGNPLFAGTPPPYLSIADGNSTAIVEHA